MKKLYCIKCNKLRKFKKPVIASIFDKTLVLSINCDKCGNEDEKIFKKEAQLRY